MNGFNQRVIQIGAVASRLTWLLTLLLCLGLVTFSPVFAEEASRCLTVEFYYDASQAAQTGLLSSVEGLATKVGGITLRPMNIHDAANRKRLEQISKHFALEAKTPALYGCGRAFVALRDETHARQSLDQLRTLTMYGRAGCPRFAAAKELLKSYGTQFPGLIIKTHDIVADSAANTELQSLLAAHRTTAASVPVFHLCDQVVVGFLDPASGKARLAGVLEKWSLPCKKKKEDTTPQPSKSTRNEVACNPDAGSHPFWLAVFSISNPIRKLQAKAQTETKTKRKTKRRRRRCLFPRIRSLRCRKGKRRRPPVLMKSICPSSARCGYRVLACRCLRSR